MALKPLEWMGAPRDGAGESKVGEVQEEGEDTLASGSNREGPTEQGEVDRTGSGRESGGAKFLIVLEKMKKGDSDFKVRCFS